MGSPGCISSEAAAVLYGAAAGVLAAVGIVLRRAFRRGGGLLL